LLLDDARLPALRYREHLQTDFGDHLVPLAAAGRLRASCSSAVAR
jgi:hypothetical protein